MRNQFRSLDDDEVEFLDAVLESTRAKEAEVKKQTSEQLDAFRRQQEEAEKGAKQQDTSEAPETTEAWSVGPRKRKKGRESTIGGVKLRRTSTADQKANADKTVPDQSTEPTAAGEVVHVDNENGESTTKAAELSQMQNKDSKATKSPSPPAAALGLAAYSSDEDD